jgi:hypothetical protein
VVAVYDGEPTQQSHHHNTIETNNSLDDTQHKPMTPRSHALARTW